MRSRGWLVGAALLVPGIAAAQDVTLGGQVRIRGEGRDPIAGGEGGGDTFSSMRARASLLAVLDDNVSVFMQLQDVRIWGEERNTLSDFSADNLDLHQGYIDVRSEGDAFLGRFGRQEVNFGGQRLVGAVGWSQQGRSFDGVRLEATGERGTFRLLGAQLGNDLASDVDRDAQLLAGYGTIDVTDSQSVDLYLIYNRSDSGGGPVDTGTDQATFGARWVGEAEGFTYRAEASLQRGDRGGPNVSAYMFGGRVGRQFGKASATLWYDYLSGDDDPANGDVKVFDTLFATNHKFYGLADLFLNIPVQTAGGGLQDLALKLAARPREDWRIAADLHSFRLAEGGALADGHLGEEIDLIATWNHSANLDIQGGVAFVLKDDAWAQIGGLSEDMFWVYLMMDAHF